MVLRRSQSLRLIFEARARARLVTTPARNTCFVTVDQITPPEVAARNALSADTRPSGSLISPSSRLALARPRVRLTETDSLPSTFSDPEAHDNPMAAYYFEPGSNLAPSGPAHPFGLDAYAVSAATRLSAIRDEFWTHLGSEGDENKRQRAWTALVSIPGPFDSVDGRRDVEGIRAKDCLPTRLWPQPLQNQAHKSRAAFGHVWPRAYPMYYLRGPSMYAPRRYTGTALSGSMLDIMSPLGNTWKIFMGRAIRPLRSGGLSMGTVHRMLKMQIKMEKRGAEKMKKMLKSSSHREERKARATDSALQFRSAFRSAVRASAPASTPPPGTT